MNQKIRLMLHLFDEAKDLDIINFFLLEPRVLSNYYREFSFRRIYLNELKD
jgi:hypothetical protein